MKTRIGSISSLLTSFTVMLTILLLSFAASVTLSAASVDPTSIDKVVVDFRSEKAFASTGGALYVHTPRPGEVDPLTGGKSSWSEEKSALSIEHHVVVADTPYRIMVRVNQSGRLTSEYKYLVVVYQAKTASSYRMSLWNSPEQGAEVVFNAKGGDTGGKWVISEPLDISTATSDGNSILSRWVKGSINTLNFSTTDKNCEFYVKEFGFFKSAADAKAYYAAVDLEKSPTEYMTEAEKAKLTASVSNNVYIAHKEFTLADHGIDTGDSASIPEPKFISFASLIDMSNSGTSFFTRKDSNEGSYNYVTASDGTKCLRLNYSADTSDTFAFYRTMFSVEESLAPTAARKYLRLTYMTTDTMPASITITELTSNKKVTLTTNTVSSGGNWVTTNAVLVPNAFAEGRQYAIEYTSEAKNSVIFIKELGFFGSEEQAYRYYGDSAVAESVSYSVMNFGDDAVGSVNNANASYGNAVVDTASDAVKITYASSTNLNSVKYMAKVKFDYSSAISTDSPFLRVLYSAKNPAGSSNVSMYMRADPDPEQIVRIAANIPDTNGEFVLSDTVLLSPYMMERFASKLHNSLMINTLDKDGEYYIKALYFFPTKESADAFEYSNKKVSVSIAGNDISKYRIVTVSDNLQIKYAAEALAEQIKALTGVTLPIVTDDTPIGEYEILVGRSAHPKSYLVTDPLFSAVGNEQDYFFGVDGNDLIITSAIGANMRSVMDTFLSSFLYLNKPSTPNIIGVDEKLYFVGSSSAITAYDKHSTITNAEAPERLYVDFASDEGYFTEENGGDDWKIANGVITTAAKEHTLTYVHVYEMNASLNARLKYTGAGENGGFALMQRYTAANAYVKAGYDVATQSWYIESREGLDFYPQTRSEKRVPLTADTWHDVSFTVNGSEATLYVDGELVLTAYLITHMTPGRLAICAEDIKLEADEVEITLLSGEGTVLRNVEHTLLPDEEYREGGSVFEMNDGTLIYQYASSVAFKSIDSGKTWSRTEVWTDAMGYPNILRLNNGDWMKIGTDGSNIVCLTSSDDGKTWKKVGTVCLSKYQGKSGSAVNMNDKIMQSGTSDRIFYSQSYESPTEINGYIRVFCEFYFSDDLGKTWKKSNMDSFDIEGMENIGWFGECKILECADGALRMYNSWNNFGCVVYSESTDNGVTWGPITKIPELKCPRSSMQFVRDPYGENATTYYMIWVNGDAEYSGSHNARSRLSLAKSTDGKNWTFLGDIWRWESTYRYNSDGLVLNHLVDPFIKVTEDHILIGSGASEHAAIPGDNGTHGAQRQHIWSIAKDTLPEGKPMNKFTDIPLGAPYYDAITYVSDNKLFQGTSETTFSPDTAMTRSMFVTVLGRLDGADVSKYTAPTFADVLAGQWYTSFVEWAAANGVVNGLGNGLYGVNTNVTIEQACVMLARYAENKAATASSKTLADFADGTAVSAWAADAVKWAVENGVYEGQNGKLNPQAPASRAAVAAMFYNYSNLYEK